jgi:hypothetical protein
MEADGDVGLPASTVIQYSISRLEAESKHCRCFSRAFGRKAVSAILLLLLGFITQYELLEA